MTNVHTQPETPANESGDVYHRLIRILHWTMAIGFVLMWMSGVFVTNVEGRPFWVENDRQGVVRDLHKSIGLTLVALLFLRYALRLVYQPPALPEAIGPKERRLAHLGHLMLYGVVIIATLTGLAIADVHEYGNAYFGIELPQIFPTTETILGFGSTPWAYALHAIVVYGLLLLVTGHVTSVMLHKKFQNVDLLPRMLPSVQGRSRKALRGLTLLVVLVVLVVVIFSIRAGTTIGPMEEQRDFWGTTPFSN
ncbi:cytochrome b/b6 domain-containing protein [uncultured Roseobacter sp.]|uniref:cytochrome b n=1 Tax=uncultured Roseobacter sp. TaxID=114847 RepID=UPI00262B6784|nr:cytochrome b/b6 domain-containing protein [uncultured Roseobacter sp.]